MSRIKRLDMPRFPTRLRPLHSLNIENYNLVPFLFLFFFFVWHIKKPLGEKTKASRNGKQKVQALRTLNGSN